MSVKLTEIEGDFAVERNLSVGGDQVVQGSMTVKHDLTVEGWLDAKNIKGPNKGLFVSLADLQAAYPTPQDGWYAMVGTGSPFAVYVVRNGAWTATGGTMGVNGSHFMGYAPYSNPTASPSEERFYITNPRGTAMTSKTYTGYGSSNIVAAVGTQYIIWWNGTTWNNCIIERDFENANYGGNGIGRGGTRIVVGEITGSQEDHREVRVISDDEYLPRVMRMTVDGEDVEPTDVLTFPIVSGSDTSHEVIITLDNKWGENTPECFADINVEGIELPLGMRNYNEQVGVPATVVVLPESVVYVDADAMPTTDANEAEHGSANLVFLGPPPELDADLSFDDIESVTLPRAYGLLYSADTKWQEEIANAGEVVYDNNDDYTPAMVGLQHIEDNTDVYNFAIGELPEYHVVTWRSNHSINLTAIGNSERNYIVVQSSNNNAIAGIEVPIGMNPVCGFKDLPVSGSVGNLHYDAVELCVVKSGTNVIVSWTPVGAY